MEHRLSSTELARSLGDVLGRIRYRGDSFVIERNGTPVARLVPFAEEAPTRLHEAVAAWREAGSAEAGFADDLEAVMAEDRPPESEWAS